MSEKSCGCHVSGNAYDDKPMTLEYCQLHAAAPKLLEACKRLKGLIRYWQPTDVGAEIENAQIDSAYNLAEEAIAAAKGER